MKRHCRRQNKYHERAVAAAAAEALSSSNMAEKKQQIKELLDAFIDGDFQTPPLCTAASKGSVGSVTMLLNKFGADKDFKDTNGNTPLVIAADQGHLPVVEALLAAGSDQSTALHVAAKRGHDGIVGALLGKGAEKNARDHNGGTPLMEASYRGHMPVVKTLLAAAVDVNMAGSQSTALHVAAKRGHDGIVGALLGKGAEKDVRDHTGGTPLMGASDRGHMLVVKTLLAAGADVNIGDHKGLTALHKAARGGHEGIVDALLDKGADKNMRGNFRGMNGCTPLMCAGGLPVVKTLLAAGADVNLVNSRGLSALFSACLHDADGDKARVLLRGGADVNIASFCLQTPLMFAVVSGHLPLVETLLEGGADLTVHESFKGNSALHYATENVKVDHMSLLLRWGADEKDANIITGMTAAEILDDLAVDSFDRDRAHLLLDRDRAHLLLARAPADRAWRRRGC